MYYRIIIFLFSLSLLSACGTKDYSNNLTTQGPKPNFKNYLQPSYDLRKSDLWLDYYSIPKSNNINISNLFYDCPNVLADFNGDGYDDVIMTPSINPNEDKRQLLELYTNDKTNQNFKFDNTFIKTNIGTINARKAIVGDFNNDGKPDIIYADQGVDLPPYPCAEQSILLSSPDGYIQKIISSEKWFGHGVCSGDVDNDGDLDVFFTNHFKPYDYLFLNDGKGNFTLSDNFIKFPSYGVYTCEMRDINKDGFIDLITGGADALNVQGNQPSRIYWGNGHDFDVSRSIILPTIQGWGTSLDFNFKDIDGDGKEEIIINRTQDPSGNNYNGYRVQILKNTGNYVYQDITDKTIQNYSDPTAKWIVWLRVEDIDKNGKLDIFDSDKGHYNTGQSIRWEQDVDGIFKRK